ncbi:MarR family transcriptional regulator [Candidatus Woesearchaeota archaeon]|nr:MarR family transcriptional regulator [Candidatus Woesearchaeota archaeon]
MAIKEESSPEDLKSVWSKYGLRESPFITTPTRLVGILPIDKVFSGRIHEKKKLITILSSSNNTRTVVLGDFGVGKTTFVNYVKWVLCLKNKSKNEFVTNPVEIKIQPEWDANRFLLSTLSAVYNASIIFKWEDDGVKLKSLNKIKEYVGIGTQRAYQGTVGMIGGGISESKSMPPSISPEVYESLLASLCLDLREEGKQLILSYDNMENIDINKLADFFRSIKDYLQIEGLHSIFIGPPHCLSALEKHQQVHSVFTQPIFLDSLNEENVLEILKKRCEELKFISGNYIPPYEENTVRDVYKRLNNIRFTFKVLEDTALFTEKEAPCKITINEIQSVQEKEKQEILSKLSVPETKIVIALMDSKNTILIGKLAKLTNIGNTNLTRPLKDLQEKGLITVKASEEDRRKKYVMLSQNSYLRFFFASEKIEKQPKTAT